VSTSTTLAGAAGVADRFLDALLLLLLPERRLGVLERREVERRTERVRREVERFFDFFLEERREADRLFDERERVERREADLDREVDRRRLPVRFFGAFGVLARLAARRRRVVARRSAARRLEPLGIRDLRALLLFEEDLREVDREERRDEALEADFFGLFGVLARRAERFLAERDVEAEREEERRLLPFEVRVRLFGLFGVLARLAERREDFRDVERREDFRLAFFAAFSSSSSFRARFFLCLIPISLCLFDIMEALYSSFSFT